MDDHGIYKAYGDRIGRPRGGSLDPESDQLITIEALLLALDRSGERDAVLSAIEKLQLSPTEAGDVLAARAYVWAKNAAPRNFAGVPQSGDGLEAVCEAITLLELARPGTLYFALKGDQEAISYLNAAAEDGLSDADFLERRVAFPTLPIRLQSIRTSARAVLGLPAEY
jgi:hypothetical protein